MIDTQVSAVDRRPPEPPGEQTEDNGAPGADPRLSTLFEIAKILATEHDLKTMAPKLLASLIDSLPVADAGLLMLFDSAAGRLRANAAQGYHPSSDSGKALLALSLLPGESMTGQAFLTGKAALYATPDSVAEAMSTLSAENRKIFEAATVDAPRPRSAICIPLTTKDAKVGVLLLENLRQHGGFTRDDLALLRPVADLLAISIENMRLREELEIVRAQDEANRLKAEVISTLAHELRTPLTSIKGYSSALLMEDAHFDPETQHEFLKIIDEECDVLQDLIHDLLESSLIDAGFLRLELQPVRLPRLAREVVGDFAHIGGEHRFLLDFAPDFPLVDADPQRIRQVLRNLVDNAVKYSPDGGLVVVRGLIEGNEAVVSVADQGVGIAPEHLNRLFEKFFRVKSGLGRHVVGTGLGLPIARAIMESHNGRIWAESQVGQGTTLYFAIPFTTTPTDPGEEA